MTTQPFPLVSTACYSCSRDCINEAFCTDHSVSLPKRLNVSIIANPIYWGFGSNDANVLISGWATFDHGHFDFFDGFDEHWSEEKICGAVTTGPYINEQRPDVLYRTVYDPEDESLVESAGKRHYGADGLLDTAKIDRGGAEVYLIDRQAVETFDHSSCDIQDDPRKVYRKSPEKFGFGNKIATTDTVFKNITGAWKFSTYFSGNYVGAYRNFITDSSLVKQCNPIYSGYYPEPNNIDIITYLPPDPKQSIIPYQNFSANYDPFQVRQSGFSECIKDGHIPSEYSGSIALSTGIYRPSGTVDFIKVRLQYNLLAASGIQNGDNLWIESSGFSGNYPVYDVVNSSGYTEVKLLGTFGSGEVISNSGKWIAFETHDPNSCCGGVARNVNNLTKRSNNITNYHTDFGRIFNNPKNIRQSNRLIENRFDYGIGQPAVFAGASGARIDVTYPSVSDSGTAILSPEATGKPKFDRKFAYFGPFYETDKYDTAKRRIEQQNTTQGNNITCYSKRQSLEIFPDCFTQTSEYNKCGGEGAFLTHQISRLGIVYRGSNFEDECSYNSSGDPTYGWLSKRPQNINELKAGLAGQEIYMYINMSDSFTAIIKSKPCDCDDVTQGTYPPTLVTIPSPVTFPNFPKFDLYPEKYGCKDQVFSLKWAYECESATLTPENCKFAKSLYACNIKQPYTTYGFMRSLCGKQTDDKRKVITEAFSSPIQNGVYRDTNHSGTNVPMYWEFENKLIHESSIFLPLSSSGKYPFWGLADQNGRLISPYFRTKAGTQTTECSAPPVIIPYLDYDKCLTRQSGWPIEQVPFLVRIDHDDDCVGCATALMPSGNLNVTLNGLGTEYSHNIKSPVNINQKFGKYGFNHCRYKGLGEDPEYTCGQQYGIPCSSSGVSGIDQVNATLPYIGNTCGCMGSGLNYSLRYIPMSGSDIGLGWTTWNQNNSYVRVTGCDQGPDNNFMAIATYIADNGFSVYASYKLSCPQMDKFLVPSTPENIYTAMLQSQIITGLNTPLDILYKNTACSRNFPSAESDLKLTTSYTIVRHGNEGIFELIPESMMPGNNPFIPVQNNLIEVLDALGKSKHVFGCPTYIYEYACKSFDAYGNSGLFRPCGNCTSGNVPTLYCDCARIGCDTCDKPITVDGILNNQTPIEYMNSCLCDCNLGVWRIRRYNADGTETLIQNNASHACNASGNVGTVAVIYSGEYGVSPLTYLGSNNYFAKVPSPGAASSACSWSKGVNAIISGVQYEFYEPRVLTGGDLTCEGIEPATCTNEQYWNTGTLQFDTRDCFAGACGDPIPWGSGVVNSQGVSVKRRNCFPEIMTVNKIVCRSGSFPSFSGVVYDLHVSREYHNHDRKWEYIATKNGIPECYTKQAGAWRNLVCTDIPYAAPTDTVSPAYNTESIPSGSNTPSSYRGVCSAHYSTGIWKNQDFQLSYNSTASGLLWNYFNLYYKTNYPDSHFIPAVKIKTPDDATIDCMQNGTVYETGTILTQYQYENPSNRYGADWTNKMHSCLQDHRECGGDFYCNKMFFPRRKYRPGTIITKFGSLQLCTSHAELKTGDWYKGYEHPNFSPIKPGVLIEAERTKFIDGCDSTIRSILMSDVGIDDTVITVSSYYNLADYYPNLYRYTTDNKNCTIISSGDCPQLGIHNSLTIYQGVHSPQDFPLNRTDSMGYYLDKYTSLESDRCLFRPFKILVDVECCSSNIRRKAKQEDPPTMLEYIVEGVPSYACNGFVKDVPCSCMGSTCGGPIGYYLDRPKHICVTVSMARASYAYVAGSGNGDVVDSCNCQPNCCQIHTDNYAIVAQTGAIIGTPVGAFGPVQTVNLHYEIGVNGGVPNCACDGGPKPNLMTNSIVSCSGASIVLGDNPPTKQVQAYQCGDYIYIHAHNATGPGSIPSGCCEESYLCEVLGNSWKVHKDACMILGSNNYGNHSADYLNNCGCLADEFWSKCDSSVLSATITESM